MAGPNVPQGLMGSQAGLFRGTAPRVCDPGIRDVVTKKATDQFGRALGGKREGLPGVSATCAKGMQPGWTVRDRKSSCGGCCCRRHHHFAVFRLPPSVSPLPCHTALVLADYEIVSYNKPFLLPHSCWIFHLSNKNS